MQATTERGNGPRMVDFTQGTCCSSSDACIRVVRETFSQRVDCISLLDVAERSGNLNAYTSVGIGEGAGGSLVFGLGLDNTREEIDTTVQELGRAIAGLRSLSPLA